VDGRDKPDLDDMYGFGGVVIETLGDLVAGLAVHGDVPAVIAFDEAEPSTLSFAALADRAMRLAGGLAAHGIAAGEAVGLFAPNGIDWIVARCALIALGSVAVHLDPEWRGERIEHALRIGRVRRVFTSDSLAVHVRDVAPDAEILILGDPGLEDEPLPAMAALSPDEVTALFFTSGTTGLPKAVPLTHRNILCNVEALLEIGLVRADDRALLPLPLYHAYPFIVGLLVPLAAGIPVVLPHGLSGSELARALTAGEVSVIVGVPRLFAALFDGIAGRASSGGRAARLMFRALLALSVAVRRRTGLRIGRTLFGTLHARLAPRLRLLASGGAKLDAALAWRLEGLGWEVLNGYGLVETASIATFERPGCPRPGTAGQAASHAKLRIVPTEGWDEPGTGEIEIAGPLVFAGYLDNADANRAAFDGDWLRTGDVGRIDADGYLHIVGRTKEMIVTAGGKKLSPEDVERVYASSPVIRELAIVEDGDALAALVVPELDAVRATGGGRIEDMVRVALGEVSRTLPSHQRVTRFALTRERLPRTRLGKLQRFALADIYARARRAEPPAASPLTDDDLALLAEPVARRVFDWLVARFPGHAITPDTTPQLDLGIDSLAWVGLGLELEDRLGVRLTEDAVARAVTVRDLLREAVAAGAVSEAAPGSDNARRRALMADRDRWAAPQSPLVRAIGQVLYAIALPLIRLYFRLRVTGRDKVPTTGPLLIAANHASDVDPFAIGGALTRTHMRNIAWSADVVQVFFRPIGRLIARPVRMFPVDDRTPGASLAMAKEMLGRGHILVWFPESYRSPDGEIQPFQRGIGKLVIDTGAAVVPCWIEGSIRSMPRTGHFPWPAPLSVRFGDPIPAAALMEGAGEDVEAHIAAVLHDRVAELCRATRAGITHARRLG
jgi:long-chain acyl-CoA synthetase